MNKPLSRMFYLLFGIALTIPALRTTAAPTSRTEVPTGTSVPQALPQVTLDGAGSYATDVEVTPAWHKEQHWYRIPFRNITSRLWQSEMDDAFVPNVPVIVLRPGEVLHYPVRIEGLNTIITEPGDRALLVSSSPDGFAMLRSLVAALDSPVRHISPSSQESRKGQPVCPAPGGAEATSETSTVQEGYHFFRIALNHTTPTKVLDALRHAYVPDSGAIVLWRG